ncbi:unnamed protein product, partial [Amoebophrya sp. A120]
CYSSAPRVRNVDHAGLTDAYSDKKRNNYSHTARGRLENRETSFDSNADCENGTAGAPAPQERYQRNAVENDQRQGVQDFVY